MRTQIYRQVDRKYIFSGAPGLENRTGRHGLERLVSGSELKITEAKVLTRVIHCLCVFHFNAP